MVKQGPCRHCGVTSTPLWRNGPPEKPVLCNACGSRWRTKGSLTNYVPLHAREAFDTDELKVPKVKNVSFKEQKLQKKMQNDSSMLESDNENQYSDQNFHKIIEGDTCNWSSSGSAISGSDSCVHFGTTDASEITGSVQSNIWDSQVPSRKRTLVPRPKPSSVEKLTKDLCSILQEEQASNLSRTSEDDLLYESGTPLGSFEIGYGGVLIKHPTSKSIEEESEASSFPVDKSYSTNEGHSGSASFSVKTKGHGTNILNSNSDKMKGTTQTVHDNVKRKLSILLDGNFPMSSADLNDASLKKIRGNGMLNRQKLPGHSGSSSMKRHHDKQNQNYPELQSIMRSPRRVNRSGGMNPPSRCSVHTESILVSKVTDDTTEFVDHEGACFSPRRSFASSFPDTSSILVPMQFIPDNSKDDLLLDVPSGASFAEAELLHHPWETKTNHTSSRAESRVEASNHPSSSFSNK